MAGTPRPRRARAIALVALGAALVACRTEPSRVARLFLLERIEDLVASEPSLAAGPLAISHDQRRGIFQHPPSSARLTGVELPAGARLRAAVAVDPAGFALGSDGAEFRVSCRTGDDSWRELAERRVSPAAAPEWVEIEASLDRCARPRTELRIETGCGAAGRCDADWAYWGEPRIEWREPIRVRPQRLALLIVVDALRGDRVAGVEGAGPAPRLDRLAAESIVFPNAFSTAPWTVPAFASLLASADAFEPGAVDGGLAPERTTLAGALSAAGWKTAAFVDNPLIAGSRGLDRGFGHWDDASPGPRNDRRGASLVRERILRWLARTGPEPAFVLWHVMDVHGPYGARAPFGGRFRGRAGTAAPEEIARLRTLASNDYLHPERFRSIAEIEAAYDEGIAGADAEIGELLAELGAAGRLDDALIVVTADHGEAFGEHGLPLLGHGHFLTDDELHVPLLVRLPGPGRGVRDPRLVSLVDVGPTLLDALGVARPAGFAGRSVLEPADRSRPVFSSSTTSGALAVRLDRWLYVGPPVVGVEEFARAVLGVRGAVPPELAGRLSEQVLERGGAPQSDRDLSIERPAVLQSLRGLAAGRGAGLHGAGRPPGPAGDATGEERARLRALGYAGG